MEEERTTQKLLLTVALVALLVLSIVYITYSLRETPNTKELKASIIKLDEEVYGETEFNSENLNLKPILDKNVTKESANVMYIPFNVGGSEENNTKEIIYDIALVDLNIDCNLLSPYLKWKLYKNGIEISQGSLDYKFDTIVDKRLVLTNIQQDLIPYNEDKTLYDKFEFYMWMSDSCQEENILDCKNNESQIDLLNKRLSGKIEVELYGGNKKILERKPQEKLDINTCNNE